MKYYHKLIIEKVENETTVYIQFSADTFRHKIGEGVTYEAAITNAQENLRTIINDLEL
jgi:hypothetical protein